MSPTGDLARNPGMHPDWELNQPRFGLQPVLNPLSHTSHGELLFNRFRVSIWDDEKSGDNGNYCITINVLNATELYI